VSHRSYCVNTEKITDVGKKTIHLNTIELSLSEARRADLLKLIKNM
jgi:DNA-binding LytR/AlgR family response regulator